MLFVKPRRSLGLFIAIAFLVLAQVSWWTVVFLREVSTISALQLQNLELKSPSVRETPEELTRLAFHRRFMFVSESVFFVFVTFVGLFLLYRGVKFEERARETQRNFIEILTHESKTPLTALKLRLESIHEKWKADPALQKDLDSARAEVQRLISVFEKTLHLNRVERQAYFFEAVCFSDVTRAVLHRLDPLFKKHSVEVSLNIQEALWVRGDSYSLQNSVQGILENAVFYNRADRKKVGICLEARDNQVVLTISDNGPGISDPDRAKVFEKFYRGETGRRVPGTGLGLYLARTVVEAHQGMIRLVTGTQTGSQFEILLPAASA